MRAEEPLGYVYFPEATPTALPAGDGAERQGVRPGKRPILAVFCFEPQAGAVGQYIAGLAPQCAEHGVDVHIFSRETFDCGVPVSPSAELAGQGGGGVTIHVLGKDPESNLLQSAEDFTARARTAFTAAFASDTEDVTALCHEWTGIGVLTELQARGVRTILSLHSLENMRSDLSSEISRGILEVERVGLEAAASNPGPPAGHRRGRAQTIAGVRRAPCPPEASVPRGGVRQPA